jgi:tripartite-type tricarboxylate transporter receptor subunit TctC
MEDEMLGKIVGVRWLVCLLAICAALGIANAQTYPAKPVRYIVPYAPGGGTDTLARIIAQKLTDSWNVPVLVENRPGASARIGTEFVAHSAPDGYTMLMAINSHALNASLYRKLSYDPIKDFAPVALVATSPNVVVVHPSVPAKSIGELIVLAGSQPGKLSYSSGGPASGSNLAGELLKMMAKLNIVEVPYKGAAPAVTDLLGGQVSMSFVVLQTALPHITSGKLRAIAVTSRERSLLLPELPTVAESGLEGYDVVSWYGTLAPAGTPPSIIGKWNLEISRILQMADVKEKLAALGMEIKGGTPEQFDQFIRTDWTFWDKVVKTLGIHLD